MASLMDLGCRGLQGGEECPGCLDRYGVWEEGACSRMGWGAGGATG